jgi:hypothetical protein
VRFPFPFARFPGGQNGGGMGGGMGGMGGGPMDFGKSKSKFQEVPETGVKFADVAVRAHTRHTPQKQGLRVLRAHLPHFSLLFRAALNALQTGRGWRQAGAAGGC